MQIHLLANMVIKVCKILQTASKQLSDKQKIDEDAPKIIKPKNILFGCTGTIGETFPLEKIISKIPELIKNIRYTQNKLIWMKAALGIMTTDTQPKMVWKNALVYKTSIRFMELQRLRDDTS